MSTNNNEARALLQRIIDARDLMCDALTLTTAIDDAIAFLATPAAPAAPAEPVAWAQLGLRNGHTYVREHYQREPYPPSPSVQRNLNLVPLYAAPPPPPTEAEDAARLRTYIECVRKYDACVMVHAPEGRTPCDATNCQTFIDAARRAQEGK